MFRYSLPTVLTLLLAFIFSSFAACTSVAQPPDQLRHYRFLPRHSKLDVEGGFGGFDIQANIFGTFDFVNGFRFDFPNLDPYASFANVDAEAINPTDFGPYSFDIDDTLNLSNLTGRPLPVGAPFDVFHFTGEDGQGAPMNLFAAQIGRWMFIAGENQPPCCDLFDYEIRAVAHRAPFPDFTEDDRVDADDLAIWRDGRGDADNDGDTDGHDFLTLQRAYGEQMPSLETFESVVALASSQSAAAVVPEPATLLLVLTVVAFHPRIRKQ